MSSARIVSVLACVTVALGLPGFVGSASAAPPSNDVIAGATVVSGLPFTTVVDTTEATTDATDVQANGLCGAPATNNSVWYKFTAGAGDTQLAVDTTGSNYSTGVLIATGTPGSLTTRNCGPISSRVSTTPGTTYYILLFADTGTGGSLHISMHGPGPVPANDKIGKAIGIAPLPFKTTVDTTGATTDFVDTQANQTCGAPAAGNSVWYKFTPGRKHRLLFDASRSDFDAGLLIATAHEGALTTIACGPIGVTATLKPHTTYYIMAFDPFDEGGGTLRLNVGEGPSVVLHVQKYARLDARGYVHLKGTYSCSRINSLQISGSIIEIVGDNVAAASFATRVPAPKCNNGPHQWSYIVVPPRGVHFAKGKAAIGTDAFGCGGVACAEGGQTSVLQLIDKVAATSALAPSVSHHNRIVSPPRRSYGNARHAVRGWQR